MAAAAVAAIPDALLAPLGLTTVGVTWSAVAAGHRPSGVLVSLLFALVPLLEVRRVKPLLLLRADTAATARKRDWQSWLAGVATGAGARARRRLAGRSLRAGLYVSGGLACVGLVLLAGRAGCSCALVRPLTRSSPLRAAPRGRQPRPAGQSDARHPMAVGLGCFFVLSVRAVQIESAAANSPYRSARTRPTSCSSTFSRISRPACARRSRRIVASRRASMPLMRARVVGVDGRGVHLPTPRTCASSGELTREFGITFATRCRTTRRSIAGKFWTGRSTRDRRRTASTPRSRSSRACTSAASVDVGDVMRFDIGGHGHSRARDEHPRK